MVPCEYGEMNIPEEKKNRNMSLKSSDIFSKCIDPGVFKDSAPKIDPAMMEGVSRPTFRFFTRMGYVYASAFLDIDYRLWFVFERKGPRDANPTIREVERPAESWCVTGKISIMDASSRGFFRRWKNEFIEHSMKALTKEAAEYCSRYYPKPPE